MILVLALLCTGGYSIPLEEFYPYGPSVGNAQLPVELDVNSPPNELTTAFPFLESEITTLYVSFNDPGQESLNGKLSTL